MPTSTTGTGQRVVVKNFAKDFSNLAVEPQEKPQVKDGEVLLKMKMRPVDPADIFSIMGVYPGFQPKSFPAVPGLEGVGVVDSIGSGVTKFKPGQRAIPLLFHLAKQGQGAWQDYLLLPSEKHVFPIPDAISDETAAQFVVNPLTVVGFFEVLKVPEGEFILQTAAGSVLGRLLIQYAKHRKIKTINLIRRDAQIQELKSLGADHVFSTEHKSFDEIVNSFKEITGGKGAYAAVDAVGGEWTNAVLRSVREDGTVLLYGLMSGTSVTAPGPDILFRNVVLTGFWVTKWFPSLPEKEQQRVFQHTLELFTKKVIEPFTGEKFPLEKVKEALQKHSKEARGGKVLLVSQ